MFNQHTSAEVLFHVTVVAPGWYLFLLTPQGFRAGVNDMPKSPDCPWIQSNWLQKNEPSVPSGPFNDFLQPLLSCKMSLR